MQKKSRWSTCKSTGAGRKENKRYVWGRGSLGHAREKGQITAMHNTHMRGTFLLFRGLGLGRLPLKMNVDYTNSFENTFKERLPLTFKNIINRHKCRKRRNTQSLWKGLRKQHNLQVLFDNNTCKLSTVTTTEIAVHESTQELYDGYKDIQAKKHTSITIFFLYQTLFSFCFFIRHTIFIKSVLSKSLLVL